MPVRQARAAMLMGRSPTSLGIKTQRTECHWYGKRAVFITTFHNLAKASKKPMGNKDHESPVQPSGPWALPTAFRT